MVAQSNIQIRNNATYFNTEGFKINKIDIFSNFSLILYYLYSAGRGHPAVSPPCPLLCPLLTSIVLRFIWTSVRKLCAFLSSSPATCSSAVQYSTVQYSTVQCSTVQYSTAHLAAALPQVVDEAPQQHRVGLGLVARPGHVASTLTLGAHFYTNCSLMEVSISVWYSRYLSGLA